MPASSTAALAAAVARSLRRSSGIAWRRERMPVRLTIQCSSMPSRSAIGRLLTTVSGRWWPRPSTEAVRRGSLLGDPAGHLGQHGAGAGLDEVLGARLEQREERLAPADGADQRLGELRVHVGERSGRGAAVDGEARVAELDPGQRLPERRDGRLHAGRVERAGDVERAGADVVLAGGLLGLLERAALAGQHDLAGRVVVGDGDAGGLRDRLGVLDRAAEQGEHRTAVVGVGHQAAAQDDELDRVLETEHAGGGQRAELAERVAGGHRGLGVGGMPAGHRGAEDRRLGEARGLVDAWERILADELDAAIEQIGELPRDVLAHVGGLGALAGKEQGDVGSRGHVPRTTPWMGCVTAFAASHPPGGGIGATRWGVAGFAAMPGLRTVTATRYVTPLREGGSLPGLVEADDDGL